MGRRGSESAEFHDFLKEIGPARIIRFPFNDFVQFRFTDELGNGYAADIGVAGQRDHVVAVAALQHRSAETVQGADATTAAPAPAIAAASGRQKYGTGLERTAEIV